MFLFRRKIKGKSIRFQHPLPEQLDEKILEEMVVRLRAGDFSVVPKIVESHMKLAINIASQYARHTVNDSDDYVSEAFLAVLEACHSAPEKMKDNKITGFIVLRIHTRLFSYIRRMKKRECSRLSQDQLACSNEHMQAIQDSLDIAIQTDLEQKVIELRKAEHNDSEIAEMLGISETKVRNTRHNVEVRFNADFPTFP